MSTQKAPAFIVTGSRLAVILVGVGLIVQLTSAVPVRPYRDEPAATRVVVVVPEKCASFKNLQVEVVLYEYDPRVKGQETLIDKKTGSCRHEGGAPSTWTITVGANARVNPEMHYYVVVAGFNQAGKRTHLGEKDGKAGICHVLTNGTAKQVTMIVRAAREHDIVMDIAAEIKKGNDAKARKLAQAGAKDFEEICDVMQFYRMRTRGGLGWGATPGNIPGQDGIEIKLRNLTRAVFANFAQDAKNNEEAATWIAAMAELTAAKPDFMPMGRKTIEDWKRKADQLRNEADAFGKAVAAQNALAIQQGALAITKACTECHAVYKD